MPDLSVLASLALDRLKNLEPSDRRPFIVEGAFAAACVQAHISGIVSPIGCRSTDLAWAYSIYELMARLYLPGASTSNFLAQSSGPSLKPILCVDCKCDLGSGGTVSYGAGDGTGQRFRCRTCHEAATRDLNANESSWTPTDRDPNEDAELSATIVPVLRGHPPRCSLCQDPWYEGHDCTR